MPSTGEMLAKGVALYAEGALHDSARLLEACVRECQQTGDDGTERLAMSNLSEAYMRLGRLKDAEHTSLALLALARRGRSYEDEVRAVGRLAMALLAQERSNRWADLRCQLEESVKTARRIGLRYWVVQNLETLGCFAVRIGEVQEGFEWLQMASNAIDDEVDEAEFFRTRIYCGLAEVMLRVGKPRRAREYAGLAVQTAETIGSHHLLAVGQLCKARVELELGEPEEALHHALRVRVAARREAWKTEQLAAEKLLVRIQEELDRADEAREAAMSALALAYQMGLVEEAALRLIDVGRVHRKLGDKMEAQRNLHRAIELADELGSEDLAARARLELLNVAPPDRRVTTGIVPGASGLLR